jgi:molybdopterin-containing oxidoreductase family iron-sulfur binding subunit
MKNNLSSRRNFIKLGVATGASALFFGRTKILSAFTGNESKQKGEKIKALTQDGKLVDVDKEHMCCAPVSNQEARQGMPGKKMVMVIDLAKCRNARKCLEGCQSMHNLPPHMDWIKFYLMRDSLDTAPYWFPKPCLHCNNPPCVKVCPVGATFKRTDGIVLIDNERCIGCKFCMAACPYSSRVFNWEEPKLPKGVSSQPYSPETSSPPRIGTVSKCDFCPDRVRMGELPACVTSCPNGVYWYGDKNEDAVTNGTETVRFSDLIHDRAAYRFMEELGTEPSVFYLPPVNRAFDYKTGFEGLSDDEIALYKKEARITEK